MGLLCTQQALYVHNHVNDDSWHLSSTFSDLRTINLRINPLDSAHSEDIIYRWGSRHREVVCSSSHSWGEAELGSKLGPFRLEKPGDAGH